MKRFASLLVLLTFVFGTVAGSEINYFNKSWEEIKAKAKSENKYIFVDCYTGWCNWCKVMDKETMPDPNIVGIMDSKFIAVKMDMEHGEGVKLAMKYHINVYPTFMFFSPKGEFVYESVGYEKAKDFMNELNNALNKSKQFKAPGFSASIDVDFPEFYKLAFAENGKKKFPELAEVNAFLDKQKNLFSEVNWAVIARFDVNTKYTKFFFDNIKKYEGLYGKNCVNNKVYSVLNSRFRTATKNKDNALFEDVLTLTDKYVKDNPENMKLSFRLEYYSGTKNWDKFSDFFKKYIEKDGYDDVAEINSLCWGIYEGCDDKKMLTKACSYMGKAVDKEPKYAYLDTYASLLYKSGQLKDAEDWANRAIAEGKKNGDDVSATETLLSKIKGGK